jgi:hypothetical protein
VIERTTAGPHASQETVERYVQGTLRRDERRELELHLAACVECQAAVAAAGDVRRPVLWRGHRFARPDGAETDLAADRLRGVMRGLGVATDAFGASLLSELLAASEHERRALVARDPRFASLPLAERLAASCRAAWIDDPEAAVEIARLAVAVAGRLDRDRYGPAAVDSALSLAWSQLGDSYRIAAAAGDEEVAEGSADDGAEAGEPGDYPLPRAEASSIGDAPAYGEAAHVSAALGALAETRESCLARQAGFEAALVTLDLAAGYLRLGEAGRAADLILASPGELAEAGLAGAGLARFEALARAVAAHAIDATSEINAIDPDLLAAAGADLQRARNDPAERFRADR